MKRIVLSLLIVLFAVNAHAQLPVEYTIWGRVVLPEGSFSKQGGIEVRLELGTHLPVSTLTTDDDGKFTFRSLSEGLYYLVINLDGFSPISQEVRLRNSAALGDTTQPRVTLYLRRGPTDTNINRTFRNGDDPKEPEMGSPPVISAEVFKKYPPKAVKEYQDGLADAYKGNADKALGHFAKAVQLEPKFYEAHMEIGLSRQRAGQILEAKTAFGHARDINPASAEPLTKLGAVMMDEGRVLEQAGKKNEADKVYDDAADVLDAALKLDLSSTEAHYLLGSALFKLSELPGAEMNLKQAIEAPKPFQDARLMLVNVYMKQRRYKEALDELGAYLAANPNSPQRQGAEQLEMQIKASIKP